MSPLPNPFTKGIQITSPSSGDVWPTLTTRRIRWRKWGSLSPKIRLGLFTANGRPVAWIANPAPNSGSFLWPIPRVASGRYMIGIATMDRAVHDLSNPFNILRTSRASAIGAGEKLSLAIIDGGLVYGWGLNGSVGYLGDGSLMAPSLRPIRLGALDRVTQVSASSDFVLALRDDGTVWSWGRNFYGNLGDGTTTDRKTPVQVQNLADVSQISAMTQSLALKSDGTVWMWGYSLSSNGVVILSTPVQVQGIPPIVAIAAGGGHSLALDQAGNVWAWGFNGYGQLGRPADSDWTEVPAQVPGLGQVAAIAAGTYHSVALLADGTVRCWGSTLAGELGNGMMFNEGPTSTPVQAVGLGGVKRILAGYLVTYAITNDDALWAFGFNGYGQWGCPNEMAGTPMLIQSGIAAVAAGYGHCLFLRLDGTLQAAGLNHQGQLGDGTTINRPSPVAVSL